MPTQIKTKRYFYRIFSSSFFMSVSIALIAYFLSSYMESLVGTKYVGLAFTFAYLISMAVIIMAPAIISKFGAVRSFLAVLAINLVSLFVLAFGGENVWTLLVFIVFLAANSLVWVNYDVLLEMFSKDKETGRTRALGLTLMNIGWVITPVLAGYLLGKYGMGIIFTIAAILLIPPFFIVLEGVKGKKVHFKANIPIGRILSQIRKSPSFRAVFILAFLLSFFYSWMVIYTPLYLLDLGYDWATIGKMFSVMLIPFVIFQYPAGYLADKYLGEKEMISLALVIMGLATSLIFLFKSVVILTVLLFCTRVGASILDVLRDSYFYKHVKVSDVEMIGAFRNTGPLAYVVGPLVATGVATFLPVPYLYPILGVIMLCGLFFSLSMPDTK